MPTYHYALTGALERRKVRKQLDIMPTYHYVQNQGKLMMQSQKKAKNLNLANFLTVEVKYIQIVNFSENYISFKLKFIFSTNFRQKNKKNGRVVFEKNIKVSDFGLILRPFCKYLQIKIFFQKSGCDFSTFIVP